VEAVGGGEKLVGGNGGLTRIIWNRRKEENWESACRARVYTCERVRSRVWERKDGECMKRERNDGKKGWREYMERSLDRAAQNEFRASCT